MATSDRRAAGAASLGVGLVAITAAVISFSHVRAVALRAGESDLTSWLLPISIDGAVVAAASVLLADSRAGRRPAPLTWMLLTLGIGASLAANVASAEPTATARAVAAWPPIALALGIEVLAGLARRDDAEEIHRAAGPETPDAGTSRRAAIGNPSSSAPNRLPAGGMPGTVPVLQTGSSNGQSGTRQPAVDDGSAINMIRTLDRASPTGRASRLEIQKTLGCGGSRAARLAELARDNFEELSRP